MYLVIEYHCNGCMEFNDNFSLKYLISYTFELKISIQ